MIDESKTIAVQWFAVPVRNLDAAIDLFSQRFGFRLDGIFPADNPRRAILSHARSRVRLHVSEEATPLKTLEAEISGFGDIRIPDRFLTNLEPAPDPGRSFPNSGLVINNRTKTSNWKIGRAGMRYRDLIPGSLGGFIGASDIQIPGSGPVPDYVHYHKVRFQTLFCVKGSAKLVYEDQGRPFMFGAGDCVLQPPEIRHRVLESSGDLQVIEISGPAEHETFVEHEIELPTNTLNPKRDFKGQRFQWTRAHRSEWKSQDRLERRGLNLAGPSGGIIDGGLIRFVTRSEDYKISAAGGVVFVYVLKGKASVSAPETVPAEICVGDAVTISIDRSLDLAIESSTELLELRINPKGSEGFFDRL